MPQHEASNRAWHPRQESKRRKTAAPEGASQTERLIKLMSSDGSPAKVGIANSRSEAFAPGKENQVYTPSKLTFSSPQQGPRAKQASTPNGTRLFPSRILTFDDGETTLFLPANKVEHKSLKIPSVNAWLNHSPVPQDSLEDLIDIPLTLEKFQKVEKLKFERQRRGENPRGVSQNKLMNIPATRALRLAGIEIEDGGGQWLHSVSHSHSGDEAQCVKNIGLGTRQSNAAMELVNPVIKEILRKYKDTLPVLYLTVKREWVPGFERIRLLKSITLIIKEKPGNQPGKKASIQFDTLSLSPVCISEIPLIRQALLQKFAPPVKAVIYSPSVKRATDEPPPLAKRLKKRPITSP